VRDDGPTLGNAISFRLEASIADALFLGTEWNTSITVTLGDIINGISLTSSQCLGANESVVYIGEIYVMYAGFAFPPQTFTVMVKENLYDQPPGIYITECAPGNPLRSVFGGTFVFNGSCLPYDPRPSRPSNLTGRPWYKDCNLAALFISWDRNPESDISHYNLYKDTSEAFTPGPLNLLTSRADTSFYDRRWSLRSSVYYMVAAVDSDGVESDFALLRPEDVAQISPSRPSGFTGNPLYNNCNLTALCISWDPNMESDISHYNLYKDTTYNFMPGPLNLLTSPFDTLFYDDQWTWTQDAYYKVSAVHCNGIESDFALLRHEDVARVIPSQPGGLSGTPWYYNNTLVALIIGWNHNIESEISHYKIYKGDNKDFVPGQLNLLASPVDTFFYDGQWAWTPFVYYKVSAVHCNGMESDFALLRPDDVTESEAPITPEATYLAQNFPNPFNPVTRIAFGLYKPGIISLKVYDVAGRLVREIVKGELPAGRYERVWDGNDAEGSAVSSGIYFYRLEAGTFTQTRKMVLLR
jgi:hypothetical protein